jgi:hypothetical protein
LIHNFSFRSVAGIIAGQPFDTVKVRLQTDGQSLAAGTRLSGAAASSYTGSFDCTWKIMRFEGPLAFYKGMVCFSFFVSF